MSAVAEALAAQAAAPPPPKRDLPIVQRFGMPELNDRIGWLLGRLRPLLPHLQDVQITSWLRGMIDSNEYCFICTKNAVACAMIVRDQFVQHPWGRQRFVFFKDAEKGEGKFSEEHKQEAVDLYAHMKQWCRHQGCAQLELNTKTSDLSRPEMKAQIGKISISEVLLVSVV